MILSPIQDGCSSSSDVTHECDQSMIFLESRLSTQWWEGRGRAKFTRYVFCSSKRGWRESFVLSWFIRSKGGSLFTRKFVSWYHCSFVPLNSLKSWIIQDVTIQAVSKKNYSAVRRAADVTAAICLRTKAFFSAENWTLFSCKFRKKFV